jgi:hypothetical protein
VKENRDALVRAALDKFVALRHEYALYPELHEIMAAIDSVVARRTRMPDRFDLARMMPLYRTAARTYRRGTRRR